MDDLDVIGSSCVINQAILTKLTYERYGAYISAACLIVNLCRKDQFDENESFQHFVERFDLMAYEVEALDKMLDDRIMEALEQSAPVTDKASDCGSEI